MIIFKRISNSMVLLMSNSWSWIKHADLWERDVSGLEVFVVLKGNISGVPVVVWRPVCLFEAWVFLTHLHLTFHHSSEIPSGKDAVLRYDMVESWWLIVVQVRETCSVWVAQEEWHEGVSIINGIEFTAFHELFQVVLNYWALMNCGSLGPCCVHTNAVTECEYVIESFVL